MKKALFFTVLFCLVAGTALAHDVTGRIGLGFDTSQAPIGLRYFFSPKIGVDIGVGFDSNEVDIGGDTEKFTDFSIAAGLPIRIHETGDRVNFNFLPLLMYTSSDQGDESDTFFDILAALEFEAFVTNDLSVSAIMGIGIEMFSPADDTDESTTDIFTVGSNLTEFGVHYYLPGS
jgi:hypothetical protein